MLCHGVRIMCYELEGSLPPGNRIWYPHYTSRRPCRESHYLAPSSFTTTAICTIRISVTRVRAAGNRPQATDVAERYWRSCKLAGPVNELTCRRFVLQNIYSWCVEGSGVYKPAWASPCMTDSDDHVVQYHPEKGAILINSN